MADPLPTLRELKELYARDVNIMGLFRALTGSNQNTLDAILVAYDLQAGSYIRALADPIHRQKFDRYAAEIAGVLSGLGHGSILEAGVGEATTLCAVASRMDPRPARIAGFDISWSRIACGRRYAERSGVGDFELFTGDLFHIPAAENSFDIVYTAHSIEPNHGREREALAELYRVTRRWLALFEPTYELGNAETQARIEQHSYCRGLPQIAGELGLRVARHELLRSPMRDNNQTALLLIEKQTDAEPADASFYACPACREALLRDRGNFFCESCSLIYPVIGGIPCLLPANGILGSKYLEAL
jgi:ubiquinone/menaquinone biosynthesis C-methylase UbiE/uncharacterized protein YbaR (Trm112 family)